MWRWGTAAAAAEGDRIWVSASAPWRTARQGRPDTVTISGRAYAFNHMDTFLAGATIRVRELPGVSGDPTPTATTSSRCPTTPTSPPTSIRPTATTQIDLQTFHTRGEAIENANFQTPGDLEYNGARGAPRVPLGPDGRPEQCVIVTTASARNVRGVDYETFHERTPHGVAGATAHGVPGAAAAGLLQRERDPRPRRPRPRGTAASSGPRSRRGLPGGHERRERPALPASSRPAAGPDRQREPAVGRLRAEEGREAAARRRRRRYGVAGMDATRRLVHIGCRIAEPLAFGARCGRPGENGQGRHPGAAVRVEPDGFPYDERAQARPPR